MLLKEFKVIIDEVCLKYLISGGFGKFKRVEMSQK